MDYYAPSYTLDIGGFLMAKKEIIEVDDNAKAKARYWVAVGYPENMRLDWQDCRFV